jgi:hypothetical protein
MQFSFPRPQFIIVGRHEGPASGGTITLDEEAIYARYNQAFGWDVPTTKSQVIDVYNSAGVSNFRAANSSSIVK